MRMSAEPATSVLTSSPAKMLAPSVSGLWRTCARFAWSTTPSGVSCAGDRGAKVRDAIERTHPSLVPAVLLKGLAPLITHYLGSRIRRIGCGEQCCSAEVCRTANMGELQRNVHPSGDKSFLCNCLDQTRLANDCFHL